MGKTAEATKLLEKALSESQDAGLAFVDEADCLKWAFDLTWHRLRPGGLYSFEQDGCYGGYNSGRNFIAPGSSTTGWARSVARKLAMGEAADGAQAIFMHKNLIVAQRQQHEGIAPIHTEL